MEINSYNEANAEIGGKTKLQRFEKDATDSESDTDDQLEPPKRKKKKKKTKGKPMILAVCTPLMFRVHENIQQAGEMTFCDATSSLDRFNTSLFILSTSHPAGGLPLGVIITSDEQEETIRQGLELLKEVLPEHSFYGRGVARGPGITMTDDSSAERNALHNVWPEICLLLCVFHFLQRRWTRLHFVNLHLIFITPHLYNTHKGSFSLSLSAFLFGIVWQANDCLKVEVRRFKGRGRQCACAKGNRTKV